MRPFGIELANEGVEAAPPLQAVEARLAACPLTFAWSSRRNSWNASRRLVTASLTHQDTSWIGYLAIRSQSALTAFGTRLRPDRSIDDRLANPTRGWTVGMAARQAGCAVRACARIVHCHRNSGTRMAFP